MGEIWHSTAWLQAIYDTDLSPVTRLVAHVYSDLAGKGREAWCTNRELRRRTGLSERAARAHRSALVDGGWLVQTRGARHHHAAHYLLVIPAQSTGRHEVPPYSPVGGHEVPVTYPQGGTTCRLGRHEVPPSKEREITNSPLSSTSPARHDLVTEVARAAGWDDDDERLTHLEALAAHHDARRPRSWLLHLARSGDLDARLREYLAATSPPPRPERWRCPDHVGVIAAGDRCPRCVEEIRTGDRPMHLHGRKNSHEETA